MVYTKSMFESDLQLLPKRSKASIFALLLTKISNFRANSYIDYRMLVFLDADIKKLMLNHEQNLSILNFHLKQTLKVRGISPALKVFIKDVSLVLSNDKFCKSYDINIPTLKDLETRIPRQLESQLAITLLQSPTDKMWASVNKVSSTIINILKTHDHKPELFKEFLQNINGKQDNEKLPNLPLAFAHFSNRKTLRDVIEILEQGNDLASIMLIHFMFMRDAFLLIDFPNDFYHNILSNQQDGDFEAYLRQLHFPDDYKQIGLFFCFYTTFASELYADRGRSDFQENLDNHLGIVIHKEDRALMPQITSFWYPDSICQQAYFNSDYVKLLVKNDIPYVAGPSGMTSLFSGALTLLGNFTKNQDKNYYLLAVLAFMVSGGLHSIHEVLTIPKVRLGLLRKYQIEGNKLANYNTFFSLFANDNQVVDKINTAWTNTIHWMKETYPEASLIKEISSEKSESVFNICSII